MTTPTSAAHKRGASLSTELSDEPAAKIVKILETASSSACDTTEGHDPDLGKDDPADGVVNDKAPVDSETSNGEAPSKPAEVKPDEVPGADEKKEQNDDVGNLTQENVDNKEGREQSPSEAIVDSNPTMVKEHVGDLFAAPDNAVLIHACNTAGSWGGGIAVEFKKRYPNAFKAYNKHCIKDHVQKTNPVPRGSCFLIPPCETDSDAPKHWIGCLFTSAKYGKAKDPPDMILRHTTPAFDSLLDQLRQTPAISEVRMCQINSGLFAVPWKDTKKLLEDVLAAQTGVKEVHVYSLDPSELPASKPGVGGRKPGTKLVKRQPPTGKTAPKGQTKLKSFFTKK